MDYYQIVKKEVIQYFNDLEINDIQILSVCTQFFLLTINSLSDLQMMPISYKVVYLFY